MPTGDFSEFLRLLFGSFFRWWWAVITGVASVLSYLSLPTGLMFGRLATAIVILAGSTLVFMCVTVIYQGWALYRGNLTRFTVTRWQRSDHFGGEFVFLIDDHGLASAGTVAELRRFDTNIEVAFGLIEFVGRDSNRLFQARPIWLEPAHVRDYRTGTLPVTDIIVRYPVSVRSIDHAMRQVTK